MFLAWCNGIVDRILTSIFLGVSMAEEEKRKEARKCRLMGASSELVLSE